MCAYLVNSTWQHIQYAPESQEVHIWIYSLLLVGIQLARPSDSVRIYIGQAKRYGSIHIEVVEQVDR